MGHAAWDPFWPCSAGLGNAPSPKGVYQPQGFPNPSSLLGEEEAGAALGVLGAASAALGELDKPTVQRAKRGWEGGSGEARRRTKAGRAVVQLFA